MKRSICVLLAVALLLSCCVSAGAASTKEKTLAQKFETVKTYVPGQFTDVAESAWYAKSVKAAYELGIVKGSSATTFNPDGNITLAETITLAARLHNTYSEGRGFASSQPWYQTYVDYAAKEKIIEKDRYFDLSAPATRAQFAEIFAKALPKKELEEINRIEEGAIPDVPLGGFYADEVYMLYRAGVLTGNDAAGTFTPNSSIQRSAVAAIVARMANKDMRKGITLNTAGTEVEGEERVEYKYVEYKEGLYTPYALNSYYNVDGEIYAGWDDHSLDLLFGEILLEVSTRKSAVTGSVAFGYEWASGLLMKPAGRALTFEVSDNRDNVAMAGDDKIVVTRGELVQNLIRHEKKYGLEKEETRLPAGGTITTRTLRHNRRVLTEPTREDIQKAGFEKGNVYDWNGVRIYIAQSGVVCYNYNDLAEYFGVKRTYAQTIRENEPTLIVTKYQF